MSDEIISTLGFDAGPAINALKQLDAAHKASAQSAAQFAAALSNFNGKAGQVPTTLAALAKSAQALGASLGAVPGAAGAAAGSLTKLASPQTGAQLAATGQQVERLTVSLGLISRVVATQLIVKSLRTVEQAIGSAAKSAAQFQTQLAQIGTIAGQNFSGLEQMGDAIRGVSDALNVPLEKTAGALFEAVQAQIGKNGNEQIQFLKTVAEFSKATVSSIESAGKTLAGALNAFDLSVSDADSVASAMFRTLDLGVLSAEQLGTAFGRVAPLARQLSVGMNEVLAGLSVLTRRGVNAPEAATQLRGILTAFAKPTDELKSALKSAGATSPESLFQAEGFSGALQKIVSSTDGTTSSLAKLFPNVRGLSGALSLGGQAAKDFASDLSQIQGVSSSLNSEKSKDILGIDGQKLETEVNKLKNILTVDFGQAVLRAGVNLSSFAGGADSISAVVKSLGPAFLGSAAAVGIFAAQSRVAALNGTALGSVLGKLGTGLALLGTAISAGDFIGGKLGDALTADFRALEKSQAEALAQFKTSEQDKIKAASEADQARVRSTLQASAEITKAFINESDSAQVQSKRVAEGFERNLQRISGAREKFADEIGKAAEKARDFQKDSEGRATDLAVKADDRAFQNNLRGAPNLLQISRLTDRAQQLGRQAQESLTAAAQSGDADAIQRALKDFGRAENAAEQGRAIAERIGNRTAEAGAIKTINSLTQKQISAERELQKISADRAKALDAQKETQQAIVEKIKQAAKTATENSGQFDKDGKPLSADQLAKQTAKRQAALKEIVNLGLSSKDLSITDALGLTKLTTELGSEINKSPIALRFIAQEDSIAQIQTALQDAFKNFRAGIPDIDRLEKLTGRKLNTPDEASAARTGLADEADAIRKRLSASAVDRQRIAQLRSGIGQIDRDFTTPGRTATRAAQSIGTNSANLASGIEQTNQFRESLTRLSKSSEVTTEDIAALQARLGSIKGLLGNTVDTAALEAGLAKLREIRALQQQSPGTAADTSRLSEIETFIQQAASVAAPFEAMSSSMSAAASSSATFKANLEGAAAAAQKAAAAMSRGGGDDTGEGLWTGGRAKYFATGGPVGTDRIKAFLSRGETVMNAHASSRFAPQLTSMNSGHAPAAVTTVGDTTVNFGDINVTGGQTNAQTGDAIVTAVRRAQRRGSSRAL